MTGKNKELRWPDMPRIKHPFRLAAIMTCELLMVYRKMYDQCIFFLYLQTPNRLGVVGAVIHHRQQNAVNL